MIFEGDKGVIDAIKEKKRLMEAGEEHGHIKPLLVICGGLMRGVYGGGAVTALHELGYSEVFDDVIGLSTGSPTAAYFLGGNPRLGTSIYYEECCSDNFLRAAKLKNWLFHPGQTWSNMIDLSYLDSVFRGLTDKAMTPSKIFENRSKLHIAVTRVADVSTHYINTCDPEILHTAVASSCDIPGVNSVEFKIDGEVVVDGVVGEGFPTKYINELEPSPTHILVLTNSTQEGHKFMERMFNRFVYKILLRHKVKGLLRTKTLNRNQTFLKKLKETTSGNVPVGLVWTDGLTSGTCTNSDKLKRTADRSEKWWKELLS